MAATEESTCRSPEAMSGKGMTSSATAKATSHFRRCRIASATPNFQLKASRTAAPSTTRAQATKAGGTPSSTAILMSRYGMPHKIDTVINASRALLFTDDTLQGKFCGSITILWVEVGG